MNIDPRWISFVGSVAGAVLVAYLTASSQLVRLEERLQAEIAMRSAADTRHDAERAQDRAELREQLRVLSDKLDAVLSGGRR